MNETEAAIKVLNRISTRIDENTPCAPPLYQAKAPYWKIIGKTYSIGVQQLYSMTRNQWGFAVYDYDSKFQSTWFFSGFDLLETLVDKYPELVPLFAEPIEEI
jgi:hypothetical protein